MSHETLPVLAHPEFPQVVTGTIERYLARVDQILPQVHPSPELSLCTHFDEDDYECGDPAVIQFLPDGDEGDCAKHLRRRQLREALAEVSRG